MTSEKQIYLERNGRRKHLRAAAPRQGRIVPLGSPGHIRREKK